MNYLYFVSTGDWVVGGPGVIVRERQPQLTRSALWARPLLKSSGSPTPYIICDDHKNIESFRFFNTIRKDNFLFFQIMSIENCPLSQIPTEIVSGGPSLVIQVGWFIKVKVTHWSLSVSVSESARALQDHVNTHSCQKRKKLESAASQKSTKFC